ncbi:hypothetical protein ACFE04_012517 [Oxalis oulophora]
MNIELSSIPSFSFAGLNIEQETWHYLADISSPSISLVDSSDIFSSMPLISSDESCSFVLPNNNNIPEQNSSVDQDFSPMTSESATQDQVMIDQNLEVCPDQGIYHLLMAYGEALQFSLKELGNEIIIRLNDKACLTGSAIQRLAYYFVRNLEGGVHNQRRKELIKNYEAVALKAIYQIFPFGRFPHFAANSAILEAIPQTTYSVHIVDFDISIGIQWPPLIEELARRGQRMLRLTAINWKEENNSTCFPQSFEETKALLCEYAHGFGVSLKMEHMEMEEIKTINIRENEFLAFNCMVGLSHMAKSRSITNVAEFLEIASNNNRGIVTFGDGSELASSFDVRLDQLYALLESMEMHFPKQFDEARIAMECLFVAPHVDSLVSSFQKSDIVIDGLIRQVGGLAEMGFPPRRINISHLMEAKELVKEGESLYCVTSEADNQMSLCYLGIPLVKFSSWL